jgi:hypothetical protein
MTKLFRLMGFIAGMALASTVHGQVFLTNGLVSYYPFNGSANDAIGTNNGTVYEAVLSTNRFGRANSAYLFNGSSSYIDFGAPSNLQFTNNFTITAWFLFSGSSLQNPRIVSYTGGQGNGYELLTQYPYTSRPLQCVLGDSDFSTSLSYTQNQWYAAALVVSNGAASIYVNGTLAGSGAVDTSYSFTTTNDLHIGNDSWTTQWDWWGGLINDVRFYNRPLSTNEVAELYAVESSNAQLVSASAALRLNTENMVVGNSYQIQASPDLINWTNYGAIFIATATNAPQYVDATSSQGFYRIEPVP